METFYEVMRRQGITRRSFLKYCSLTAASLGLGPGLRAADRPRDGDQAAHPGAVAARPGMHLLLGELHPLARHPLAKDVVLSMISLDYDDTLMAAAGHQAEAILEEVDRPSTRATTSWPSRATRR